MQLRLKEHRLFIDFSSTFHRFFNEFLQFSMAMGPSEPHFDGVSGSRGLVFLQLGVRDEARVPVGLQVAQGARHV